MSAADDDGYGDTTTIVFSTSTNSNGDNIDRVNMFSSITNNTDGTTAAITMTSSSIPSSNISLQQSNWQGAIPIVVSLAPTSLSSPMAPRPIHTMISRCNYLHVALYKEVMSLANYAPISVGVGSNATVGANAPTTATSRMMCAEEPPDDEDDDNVENATKKRQDEGGNDADEVNNGSATEKEVQSHLRSSSRKQEVDITSTPNPIMNDVFPECWFEDVVTGIPLRWQLFAGILYDLVKGKALRHGSTTSRQHHQYRRMEDNHFLPWQVRVHFTCYPHDKILALDDGGGVGCNVVHSNGSESDAHRRIDTLLSRTYRNSLKQALFLQYGTSRTAMSINKQSHEQLWDAIQSCHYEKYYEVNARLQRGIECKSVSTTTSLALTFGEGKKEDEDDDGMPQLIPVRLMLNDLPAIQHPIRHQRRKNGVDSNDVERKEQRSKLEELITTYHTPPYTTLGDFLADNLPHHYVEIDPSGGIVRNKSAKDDDKFLYYSIQGIQPSLNCAMIDLWRCLSHPDHFLYVIVVTE